MAEAAHGWSDRPLDWIAPRRRDYNPRCPACKSAAPDAGDYKPPPMFHAAHPYGPCEVLDEGGHCGCTHGLEPTT